MSLLPLLALCLTLNALCSEKPGDPPGRDKLSAVLHPPLYTHIRVSEGPWMGVGQRVWLVRTSQEAISGCQRAGFGVRIGCATQYWRGSEGRPQPLRNRLSTDVASGRKDGAGGCVAVPPGSVCSPIRGSFIHISLPRRSNKKYLAFWQPASQRRAGSMPLNA